MKKVLQGLGIVAGMMMLLYAGGSMLFFGYTNLGNLGVLLAGGAVLAYALLYDHMPRGVQLALNIGAVAAALIAAALSGAMLWAAYGNQPAAYDPPDTVIVLGAKINGDQPSKILLRRLQAAAEYLRRNPEAVAIVAGGLGEGESYTEAFVMKRYLEEQGIAPARVLEEGDSVNTYENFQNSAALVREAGLDTDVAVCTDGFHQLRARIYADKAGLNAYAVSSNTPLDLIPMYVVREWFGLVKLLVLGK